MKISNETKVGALTTIGIVILLLGFNYLKGHNIFESGFYLKMQCPDAKDISVSNPVDVNGYTIGEVYAIKNTDANLHSITITIKLNDKFNIPEDSYAQIDENPLGTSSIEIKLGSSYKYLKTQDQIKVIENKGMFARVGEKLSPLAAELQTATGHLDTLIVNFNSIINEKTRKNLQVTISNLAILTQNINTSATELKNMLGQNGALNASLHHLNGFTENLQANNGTISRTLKNLEVTSGSLANADPGKTIFALRQSVEQLSGILKKMNDKQGTMGLLLNDKKLYQNLNNTVRSANILLDDLKLHPKRYVHFSIFGGKSKDVPLTAPIDSVR